MNIQEFAQSIKAKYPQYNDIPDAELGQRMLTKYPQYQDLITPDQPTAPKDNRSLIQKIYQGINKAGDFIVQDITGFGGTPKTDSFLGNAFQSSLGSRGAAGLGAAPGQALSTVNSAKDQECRTFG
jgi:hypothetical protein